MVEESSIHQMLHFLSDIGKIDPGRYLYMYLLEKGYRLTTESLTADERRRLDEYKFDSMSFSPEMSLNPDHRNQTDHLTPPRHLLSI